MTEDLQNHYFVIPISLWIIFSQTKFGILGGKHLKKKNSIGVIKFSKHKRLHFGFQTFGSQMWDAAFAIQAIMSSDLTEEYATTLRKGHNFVKASQVKSNPNHLKRLVTKCTLYIQLKHVLLKVRDNPSGDFEAMYRHISKGAWTFAMQDHGWQVSDCTAEGLKGNNIGHMDLKGPWKFPFQG